ncbi:hypothetical protein LNKW23_10880 [Paralimibaculum aggregatum]|uniref:Uncharacterized protein n=1 Tax=Paralimibaculum aggregatum TaxID=3036245 RepID=A0ABQ6LI31_9RHOB|nr:hypothetical protein [Limibaculum sp. NKW23]GMG81875.1 hypothetical protein LNKW23_10880 [Limibaculum sp. NKW23]
MTASLVSLFQARHGWTNEERAQFARIERILEDAGFAVDVEHGLSDEGEPWCVFCSAITGDVIIHVACIDGRFMFDSTTLPRPIEGASFQRCAERFFEDVSLPMPLSDRKGRVYMHPASLLASLFITVLLYAQATTEVPLFEADAVDADDPDAPVTAANPFAIKLKALAQQVAEFAHSSESGGNQQGQGYVNPALAAIPAGMALAVIAIAQDLAHAEQTGQFLEDDETLLALENRRAEEETPVVAVADAETDPAAEDDQQSRLHADLAALSGAEQAEAEAEDASARAMALSEAADLEIDAMLTGLAEMSEAAGSMLAAIMPSAAFDLFSTLADETRIAEAGDGGTAEGSLSDSIGGELFQLFAELPGVQFLESLAYAMGERVVEIEVVLLTEPVFARFEAALLEQISGDTDLALADAIDGVVVDDLDTPLQGTDDAVSGGDGAHAGGHGVMPGQYAGGGLARPEPLDSDRVVSVDEAKALVFEFMEAVGDTGIFTADGKSVAGAEDLDDLIEGLLASGHDTTFFDGSLYERGSVNFGSQNLHAEYIYLEDNTKLTFYSHAADFDGFV